MFSSGNYRKKKKNPPCLSCTVLVYGKAIKGVMIFIAQIPGLLCRETWDFFQAGPQAVCPSHCLSFSWANSSLVWFCWQWWGCNREGFGPWKAPGQMLLFQCNNWKNKPRYQLEACSIKSMALFSALMWVPNILSVQMTSYPPPHSPLLLF